MPYPLFLLYTAELPRHTHTHFDGRYAGSRFLFLPRLTSAFRCTLLDGRRTSPSSGIADSAWKSGKEFICAPPLHPSSLVGVEVAKAEKNIEKKGEKGEIVHQSREDEAFRTSRALPHSLIDTRTKAHSILDSEEKKINISLNLNKKKVFIQGEEYPRRLGFAVERRTG